MSLAQYASPYNNDDSEETSNINTNIRMTQSQNQNQNRGRGGAAEKKMPLRKTIKRPLAQQEKQQQGSESRVANFMSKLSAVKNTNHVQVGGDDGTSGIDESENDLADYQPMNDEGEKINKDDDGVVTRENFENLPSTYASQYYQQYVPLSYNQQQQQNNVESNALPGSRDDLMQKMNHIIQMLEDQQDEKTGSVTEELILYCFLGVFVIFVVDSFVRAGKYVR
jgi:hypothetical protein